MTLLPRLQIYLWPHVTLTVDLLHLSSCDKMDIGHNCDCQVWLNLLIFPELSHQKGFCYLFQSRVTLTFDLRTPTVDWLMPCPR